MTGSEYRSKPNQLGASTLNTQALIQWKQIVGIAVAKSDSQLQQIQRLFESFTRSPDPERLRQIENLLNPKLKRSPHFWPYAVLAFFNMCLNQWDSGFYFLNLMREQSQHPTEIESLMDWVREQEAFQAEEPEQKKSSTLASKFELQGDPDQLYYDLKADLNQAIERWQNHPIPSPSAAEIHLKKIKKELKSYNLQGKRFLKIIEQLESELDCSELALLYSDWHQYLSQFEQAVSKSETLNLIWSLIERDIKEAGELQRHIIQQKDLPEIKRKCEALIDHCDHVQNQMYRLQEQGIELNEVEPAYEALFESLEDIQSQLEEQGLYCAV